MQITPPPPLFCRWNFFLHANARHSKPKVASRCRHAAKIAFDLYVIARKVRKCPLLPFVTSYIVLSCLVRMADILARLVQKADSLSALQLSEVLFVKHTYNLSPPPPSTPPQPFGPLRHPWDSVSALFDRNHSELSFGRQISGQFSIE